MNKQVILLFIILTAIFLIGEYGKINYIWLLIAAAIIGIMMALFAPKKRRELK